MGIKVRSRDRVHGKWNDSRHLLSWLLCLSFGLYMSLVKTYVSASFSSVQKLNSCYSVCVYLTMTTFKWYSQSSDLSAQPHNNKNSTSWVLFPRSLAGQQGWLSSFQLFIPAQMTVACRAEVFARQMLLLSLCEHVSLKSVDRNKMIDNSCTIVSEE